MMDVHIAGGIPKDKPILLNGAKTWSLKFFANQKLSICCSYPHKEWPIDEWPEILYPLTKTSELRVGSENNEG
jgi:hypothetical protein